jgi:hypothetical protein
LNLNIIVTSSILLILYKLIVSLILFLLIRWIKKIWHIFSLIGSSLLSISLIDIYSWEFISWIKDTSIYKWYADLFSKTEIISNKKEDIPSRMSTINENSNENKTNSERSSRIIEWINRDSEKTKVNNSRNFKSRRI